MPGQRRTTPLQSGPDATGEALSWTSLTEIADQVGAALRQAEEDLVLEQAVHGLDTLAELALHTLLDERLGRHFTVTREVHYPSSSGSKRSHRQRCDLVLSPKGLPLLPQSDLPPQLQLFAADPAPEQACPLAEAFWLEVKVAYQFRPGGLRHRGYGAQFRQAVVADLRKMAAEPLIHHAGLLLIVFNENAAVASKDLALFESLLIQALAGFRHERSFRIQDRIGHHLCTVALWPILYSGAPLAAPAPRSPARTAAQGRRGQKRKQGPASPEQSADDTWEGSANDDHLQRDYSEQDDHTNAETVGLRGQ